VFWNLQLPRLGWNGIRYIVSDLFCHSKSKYAELVVVASMEVSREENVDKTKPYFMPCH
jgi:hypothetical protein